MFLHIATGSAQSVTERTARLVYIGPQLPLNPLSANSRPFQDSGILLRFKVLVVAPDLSGLLPPLLSAVQLLPPSVVYTQTFAVSPAKSALKEVLPPFKIV